MPSLATDIIGRIKRLPLRPSAKAALMPMFEALSNSLHAIDDRFGEGARQQGRIYIDVLRQDDTNSASQIVGFVVTDNGIGLNEENYKSFLKPDSQHKLERGGKGVGRLDWLKVFQEIRIDSAYDPVGETAKLQMRSFDFVLAEDEQILLRDGRHPFSATGTRVELRGFDSSYGSRCPVEPDVIHRRIIGHFVQVFAADIAPEMIVHDCGSATDLRSTFSSFIKEMREEEIRVDLDDGDELLLKIRHIRADRAIRLDKNQKNYNWLFLSAHQRAVDDAPIDEAIGLKALPNEEVYVGCIYGDYLDQHVNAERTAFTFDAEINRAIRRALIRSVMDYLGDYVQKIKEKKRQVARRVIEEYPQFLYLHNEMQEFVDKLAPSTIGKEQVFVEMCRDRFRRTSNAHKVEAQVRSATTYNEEVQEKIEQYQRFVQQQQHGVLAEYVLLRKSIIDILDKYVGFQAELDKNYLEEAIHKLIVPMRTDSSRLSIADHQLWLLDDRLAFFSFFASDKSLRSFTSNDSLERPDIAFFYETCFAWQEQDTSNTVVLVEFKRPGRDNYDGEDNPIRQLVNYIKKFKTSSSLVDLNGRTFSPRLKNAAFHCYIVADITNSLRDSIDGYAFHDTPDGEGLVGYLRNPDAFVEVTSYSKLLRDAQMRNSVFFRKLGITDIDPSFDEAPNEGGTGVNDDAEVLVEDP